MSGSCQGEFAHRVVSEKYLMPLSIWFCIYSVCVCYFLLWCLVSEGTLVLERGVVIDIHQLNTSCFFFSFSFDGGVDTFGFSVSWFWFLGWMGLGMFFGGLN